MLDIGELVSGSVWNRMAYIFHYHHNALQEAPFSSSLPGSRLLNPGMGALLVKSMYLTRSKIYTVNQKTSISLRFFGQRVNSMGFSCIIWSLSVLLNPFSAVMDFRRQILTSIECTILTALTAYCTLRVVHITSGNYNTDIFERYNTFNTEFTYLEGLAVWWCTQKL